MNADEIRQCGRKIIQKTAMIEGIQGNATSNVIITKLLEKYPEGLPRDHEGLKEGPKRIIKAKTVQLAMSVARTVKGGVGAIRAAKRGSAKQPIGEPRVTRSKAKNIQSEQNDAANPTATGSADTTMTSVMETKYKVIPTMQAGEAETTLSSTPVQEQSKAQGPELASTSASVKDKVLDEANTDLRNEMRAAEGIEVMHARPAPRFPSPEGDNTELANIVNESKDKGKGKGKAGRDSLSPSASTTPLPEDEGDHDNEAEKEAEQLLDEAKVKNNRPENHDDGHVHGPRRLPRSSPFSPSQRTASPSNDADEEAVPAVTPPVVPVPKSRRRVRGDSPAPLPSLFWRAQPSLFSAGSTSAVRSPSSGSDEHEDKPPFRRTADNDEVKIMSPRNRPASDSRRLRREGVVTCSPKRRARSSPSSSGGSTGPVVAAPRADNSNNNVLQPVNVVNQPPNLEELAEHEDGEDNRESEGDKENKEPEDEWPSRGWNSSDMSMPSDASSSPPARRNAGAWLSKDRVQEVRRECTAMTNEMGALHRRIEDLDRLRSFAELTTEEAKEDLAHLRRVRKVLEKYCLPKIAKDERLSAGYRKWMPQMEGDEPVNWYFKRDRSPSVSDDELVATDSDRCESGDEDASDGPVAGPSNISAGSGVGNLSFRSVEDWEEFVQFARDDGTLGPKKRGAQKDLGYGARKRARYD